MADRDYSAQLAAALTQQLKDQFKAKTQTAADVVAQTTGAAGANASQFGMTPEQMLNAMSGSVSSYQNQEKAAAQSQLQPTIKALESYGNNGIYATQANQDLANTALGAYTNEQLASLVNPTNVAQGIQPGGTFTNPDDQRPLMTFNDLSMLNPMANTTNPAYNAESFETPVNMVSPSSGIAPELTTTSVLDNLGNLQESAAIEALTTAKNQAMNALDQEQSTIEPQYADARSQTRALSSRSGQSFQQMLANKGINVSGQSALGETMRTGALQGEIGALNQDELAALSDIASRRTDVNIGYEGDVAQSRAQALENQIAQERSDFLSTIGQHYDNYQEEINTVTNDGDTSNDWKIPFLEAARQEKINQQGLDQNGLPIAETGIVSQEAQDALSAYNSGFRTQAVMDILTNAGYQFPTTGTTGGTTGTTTGYTGEQYNQYQNQRDNILQYYANDPQGMIDSVLGDKATLTGLLGTELYNQLVSDVQAVVTAVPTTVPTYEPTFNLDDYYNTIKAMQEEVEYTPSLTGSAQGRPLYSDGDIKAYINNLGLSLEETAELFNRLGVPN